VLGCDEDVDRVAIRIQEIVEIKVVNKAQTIKMVESLDSAGS